MAMFGPEIPSRKSIVASHSNRFRGPVFFELRSLVSARRVVACLFVFGFACVSVHPQTLTAGLNKLLDDWKEKNAPGMAAMLVGNGCIEYRKVFGFADLDARTPITPDTQFLLASITKQFTAMAIMILAERHNLQF